MAPDRIGNSNRWYVGKNECFLDQRTGQEVTGPLYVRVTDTEIGLLAVQGTDQIYDVPGDKIEDFPSVVKKINP
jgi:hypothetical protein